MSDRTKLDQLRLEKERAELRLAQEQRRLTRLENRKQYYEKGERTKRTPPPLQSGRHGGKRCPGG